MYSRLHTLALTHNIISKRLILDYHHLRPSFNINKKKEEEKKRSVFDVTFYYFRSIKILTLLR